MNPNTIELTINYETADWLLNVLEDTREHGGLSTGQTTLREQLEDAIAYQFPTGITPHDNFVAGYRHAAFKLDPVLNGIDQSVDFWRVYNQHATDAEAAWNEIQESQKGKP